MTSQIITQIRKQLKQNADEKVRQSGQRFFKEAVKLYGVKSALVSKIARENFKSLKSRAKSKKEIFELCEKLWRSGLMEEAFIACHWSYSVRKDYAPADFEIFEKWISVYIDNWATCDTFCNHTVGALLEMYPELLVNLKTWAQSKNRWMCRAAAVCLIVPARRGKFLKEIFELADILLLDGEDMVQKGYGWLLKVASQKHQKEIFNYVMKNKAVMPRTALRYAIEKMPTEMKKKAMERSLREW